MLSRDGYFGVKLPGGTSDGETTNKEYFIISLYA